MRWRLALTLLCLFASTFQSSLALAHLHPLSSAEESFVASAGEQPVESHHTVPAHESGACLLCQVLLFGGGLPTAAYEWPSRPLAAVARVTLEQIPAHFIAAVSYAWHSRGPPRI